MSQHEYSVVEHSRTRIGMTIAFLATAVGGAITTGLAMLLVYLTDLGFSFPIVVLFPLTSTAIFGGLFFLFDKFVWNKNRLRRLIGVPDISGDWELSGQSFDTDNQPKYAWEGKVQITQSYERITVYLRTSQSSSESISAAIINKGRAGWLLIYSYSNQPKPGESDMSAHFGHCEILFSEDLRSAEGKYFNGGGRFSHGTLALSKEISDEV